MDLDSNLVIFFRKSDYKNINLSVNEDFFRKYEADRKLYWVNNGNDENQVSLNLKKDNTLTKVELKFAMRYAACIQHAYYLGRCYVKWEKLLALPSRTIFEFVELYYNSYIKNKMKDIVEKWDGLYKE